MIPKKKIGKMRFNNRKNKEYCAIFECPICEKEIVRPISEGKRLKSCSQKCSSLGVKRGAYNPYIYINEYRYLYKPEHPNSTKSGYIAEHRFNAEIKIGRYLTSDEIVHHINGDKEDNSLSNLEVLNASSHNKLHAEKKERDEYGKFKF